MSRKMVLLLTGAIVIGLAGGLVIASFERRFQPDRAANSPSGEVTQVVVEQLSSYALLTHEEMIDQASAIFVGKVVSVSPTRWNQDSGAFWKGGLQFHSVELEVVQVIADTLELGNSMTLTVLGDSPLDGGADHSLKVGDQAVFFIQTAELAWQGGTRPILRLTNAPLYSYFAQGGNGLYHNQLLDKPLTLAEVISQIAQRRPILAQP